MGLAASSAGAGRRRERGACCKAHQLLPRKATSTCASTSGAGTPWAAPSAAESAIYAGAWFATGPRRKLSGQWSSGSWNARGCWHGVRDLLRTVAGEVDQVPRVAHGVRLSSNHGLGASRHGLERVERPQHDQRVEA